MNLPHRNEDFSLIQNHPLEHDLDSFYTDRLRHIISNSIQILCFFFRNFSLQWGGERPWVMNFHLVIKLCGETKCMCKCLREKLYKSNINCLNIMTFGIQSFRLKLKTLVCCTHDDDDRLY